ncbi:MULTISPECIES: hypothetical protein [unclassified Streptomyces]|uniref:hypothetical protein n=1 Tax=unclassified Streptomyces TaxID=2593676 RepID=UPI002E27D9C9|nr:hypothetical protein [Streptomyces sp. NBC_01429]
MSERPARARLDTSHEDTSHEDVERHQERLRDLDGDLIRLVELRLREDRRLRRVRRAAGRPSTDLARENAVLRSYRDALGPSGAQLALLLIGMARSPGPAPGGQDEHPPHKP